MLKIHAENPELWFRPSPFVSLIKLEELISERRLTATIRCGKRDLTHEKGYVPEQLVTLRLFDHTNQQILLKEIRIQSVESFQVNSIEWKHIDLLMVYNDYQSIKEDLSFFERRPIGDDEFVSLVRFQYVGKKHD